MTEPRTTVSVSLILAGVRSAALASHTLAFVELVRKHQPEMASTMEIMARAVLRDWGLAEETVATASPSVEATTETTLVWPPLPAALPPVYFENYYHVRQSPVMARRSPGGKPEPWSVDLSSRLQFTGSSVWSESDSCWLMLIKDPATYALWVRSTDLIAGDEIPEGER